MCATRGDSGVVWGLYNFSERGSFEPFAQLPVSTFLAELRSSFISQKEVNLVNNTQFLKGESRHNATLGHLEGCDFLYFNQVTPRKYCIEYPAIGQLVHKATFYLP